MHLYCSTNCLRLLVVGLYLLLHVRSQILRRFWRIQQQYGYFYYYYYYYYTCFVPYLRGKSGAYKSGT